MEISKDLIYTPGLIIDKEYGDNCHTFMLEIGMFVDSISNPLFSIS